LVQFGLDASMAISESVSLFASGYCEERVDSEYGHAVGGRIDVSVAGERHLGGQLQRPAEPGTLVAATS
jgi:hypothetical protein